jgi:hypothetical protein
MEKNKWHCVHGPSPCANTTTWASLKAHSQKIGEGDMASRAAVAGQFWCDEVQRERSGSKPARWRIGFGATKRRVGSPELLSMVVVAWIGGRWGTGSGGLDWWSPAADDGLGSCAAPTRSSWWCHRGRTTIGGGRHRAGHHGGWSNRCGLQLVDDFTWRRRSGTRLDRRRGDGAHRRPSEA